MRFISILVCFGFFTPSVFAEPDVNRWEKQIAAFEAADRKTPPPKQAILFVGSSSIRGWKLNKYFPDLKTINRGFGGSQMSDSVRYANRIVTPHKPKIVVVYAGDNDIADGKSPKQVADDYILLVDKIRTQLPHTHILFIAIKPSIRRWKLVDKMRKANQMIKEITKKDAQQGFIDIDKPMIGDDSLPRKELFAKDGLHLNHEGYVLWSKLTRDAIKIATASKTPSP